MESVTERWLAIPDFEGKYEVSDFGRVKSLDRIVKAENRWGYISERRWTGRVMKLVEHHTGYLCVKLGASPRLWPVHQLVARTFLGPQLDGLVVNHIDGNKRNNTPSNLEYVTNTDNIKHAYRTGLLCNTGTANSQAVLNDEIVKRILEFPRTMIAKQVAKELGLKKHNVDQVRSGRAWKHVERKVSP